MKEHRIPYNELVEMQGSAAFIGFSIKMILKLKGFDTNKPIIKFEDFQRCEMVYRQED